MKIPDQFETVKQPGGSPLCGAACCAMALGLSLDEVLAQADWRELLYVSGMARFLARFDVTMGLWLNGVGEFPEEISIECPTADRPAIVAVKSEFTPVADHWVFWDGEQIRDPAPREQSRYEVLEAHFLTYWQGPPDWLEGIPADWRQTSPRELIPAQLETA